MTAKGTAVKMVSVLALALPLQAQAELMDLSADVYFAFDAQREWKETPPVPTDWMHQLAEDERRLDGEKLRKSIEKLLKDV